MTGTYTPNLNKVQLSTHKPVEPILVKQTKKTIIEKKHLSVYLPVDILKQLKILSMNNGKRVNDVFIDAVKLGLKHYDIKEL